MKPEDRFLEKIRAMVPGSDDVLVGPGDDAAVVRRPPGDLVATTDVLVESVDFLPGEDPEIIGRRAVAVNCSDLAAMGARPEHFLLAIAFPPERGEAFALSIVRGAVARGGELGARLVGGDLSRSPTAMVAVALWGRPEGRILTRSGARPGDFVFLSGQTGRAAAGLWLAAHTDAPLGADARRELLAAHREPEPRLALGLRLGGQGLASAAIDVSDGLGVDAARLARASAVRVVLERDRIPVSPAVVAAAGIAGLDPLDWILSGGDDYELLFTAPAAAGERLAALSVQESVAVTRIGRTEAGEGAVLQDASGFRDVTDSGHDHFEAAR